MKTIQHATHNTNKYILLSTPDWEMEKRRRGRKNKRKKIMNEQWKWNW